MQNVLQALKRAQAKIEDPKKAKVNPHFKSKYVDLNAVLAAIGQACDEEGLVVTQTIDMLAGAPGKPDTNFLVTTLYHAESAEYIKSAFPLPADATPQQLGSAITYARRYSLMAMFCLGAEDDDGNAASTPGGNGKPANGFVKKDPAAAARESFKVAAEKATTLEQLERAKAAVASMDGDQAIGEAYAAALARLGKK